MSSALSIRHREILQSIVQTYIDTGEPVASRTVARVRHKDLSAATIRNVMADLDEDGFLDQPHTSAGRVPTAKAFEVYVHSLASGRVMLGEVDRMRAELRRAGTMEERIERTSHLLSELTNNVGIAAAIPASAQTLDQIELVALPDHRVLMVVVTKDKMIRNQVVTLDCEISSGELVSIRNYINHNFGGWTFEAIQTELHWRLREERAMYDAILGKLAILYHKGFLALNLAPEIHMDGASNLVGFDFHLTQKKMRDLFRALEEKKKILLLLERFLEQPNGEIAFKIGLEDAHPSMGELAIIGVTVVLPTGLSARIAVLGPTRMNYIKALSAITHLSQAIRSIPA